MITLSVVAYEPDSSSGVGLIRLSRTSCAGRPVTRLSYGMLPMSSWWTTAAIQRCSQTTPKGYTHHTEYWETLAQDRQQWRQAIHTGKSHIEERISQKYQLDHNLRHGFPDASASIICCVNCGRGFKMDYSLTNEQST